MSCDASGAEGSVMNTFWGAFAGDEGAAAKQGGTCGEAGGVGRRVGFTKITVEC